MIRHRVSILNRSSLSNAEVHEVTAALRTQAQRDFAHGWGINASVHTVESGDLDSWKGSWNIVILDKIDEAGALGYHDLTPEAEPAGFVGLAEAEQAGEHWSSVASHELLEMLGDPYINLAAEALNGYEYAYEACDAVEGDAYLIDGVTVSNFVLPAWFCPEARGKPLDHLGMVTEPFELAPGGYSLIRRQNEGWSQIWGSTEPGIFHVHDHTRRFRRMKIDRTDWQLSIP